MRYHPLGEGRYFLRLEPSDEVLGSLRQIASEVALGSAFVHGTGWLSQATLGFLEEDGSDWMKRRFDEPLALTMLSGTITVAADDGRPHLDLKACLAPREHISYGGQLLDARVGAVVEIIVVALGERLERVDVAQEPYPRALPWLFLPGEQPPQAGDGN